MGMKKILVFYKTTPKIEKAAKQISVVIEADIEADTQEQQKDIKPYDLIITIGGDGTILHAETRYPGIPKLPLGAGDFQFLTSATPSDWPKIWTEYQEKKFWIEKLTKISCGSYPSALNEIYFTKKTQGQVFRGKIYIDGQLVDEIKADGVVIATPTGSTAYGLSAGGSILDPKIKAFSIVPVVPFTRHLSPLIVPDNSLIEIISLREADLIIDGISVAEIKPQSHFKIQKAKHEAQFIRFGEKRNFYPKLHLLR